MIYELSKIFMVQSFLSQLHLVFDHLAEYVEMEGMGMALFSEQTGESLHSDFKKTWLHYQVKTLKQKVT